MIFIMIATTDKKIEKTIQELSLLDKQVRRKLLEVETLMSLRDIHEGKTTRIKKRSPAFDSSSLSFMNIAKTHECLNFKKLSAYLFIE